MLTEQQIQELEREISREEQMYNQKPSPYSSSMLPSNNKQNLVEWELDFKQELIDIERLLRCDILMSSSDGSKEWTPNPDETKVFLNELGVNDVLRALIILVNKNKVLSNYTIEEIRERVRIIGHELRIIIYNNYEAYGIDNEYKMHNYSFIVISILCIIEDAYRRALGGETHRGLAEQRLVTQTEPLQNNYPSYQGMQQKKGLVSRMLPWNWGK